MKLQRRTAVLLWLSALVIGMALHAPIASAVVTTYRSAVIFGTASTWSGATFGSGSAPQGIYWNSADGMPHVRLANGTEFAIPQSAVASGGGYATVKNAGTPLTQRASVNFLGSGISCIDNSGAPSTDCTIKAPGVFNALDYGAKGDGTTDDSSALASAFSAASAVSGTVVLPKGTYKLTSTFNWTYSNVNVVGQAGGGVTITSPSSSGKALDFISTGTIQNVTFQGIKFASTYSTSSNLFAGVVNAFSQAGNDFAMTNVQFIDCEFTAPTAGHGLQLVAQSPTNKVFSNVTVLRGNFHDLGLMGVQVQNHVADSVNRYQNIVVRESSFTNTGLQAIVGYGVCISYSGNGLYVVADNNTFDHCQDGGIELTSGAGGAVTNNRFKGFAVGPAGWPYVPIIVDNTTSTTLPATVITGNQEMDDPGSSAVTWNFFYLSAGSVISNNVTRGSGFSLKTVANTLITGNNINSRQNYGIFVGTSSTANKIVGNVINTTAAASPFSVVRFDSAGSTSNELADNDLVYSAGVSSDQTNSASGNYVGTNRLNGTVTVDANICTLTGAQSLTNKTITGGTIASAALTSPTISGAPVIDATSAMNLCPTTCTSETFGNTTTTSSINLKTTSAGFVIYPGGPSNALVDGAPTCTSGTTVSNSPQLGVRGCYWTGSASASDQTLFIHTVTSTTPTSYLSVNVGGNEVERLSSRGLKTSRVGSAIASATTIAPVAAITHITGTTTIQTITAPSECAATNEGCSIDLVFDGVAPWNAAGNIFVAGTPTTAGTTVRFTYDNATSKWYPARTL